MPIILDKKSKDTALQEMIEKIKRERRYNSDAEAVYEAIRFYIEERPRIIKKNRLLHEDYYNLKNAVLKKIVADCALSKTVGNIIKKNHF